MKISKVLLATVIAASLGACSSSRDRIKELEERTLPSATISLPAPPADLMKRPAELKPIPNQAPVMPATGDEEPLAEIPVADPS